MGKKILFSPVGGTDPIKYFRDGSMLHICRVYKPDIVYLYLSHEMLEQHRKDNRYAASIEHLGELLNHTFEVRIIERDDLIDVQQYDVFYMDFRKIIKEIEEGMEGDDQLLINMASGTPAMKSALLVMATLAEYRFLPIQVSTPLKRINAELEDRKNYEVELNWELNEDNQPDFENRCQEVKCLNLMKLLKIDMIKKHILAYDYTAAKTIAEEIKEDISKDAYNMIKIASERVKLNRSKISKMMVGMNYDIFPIKEGNKQKIFEYVLGLGIKIEKEEYADFIRGITPVVVDLFENILEKECRIKVDDYCRINKRKKRREWDIEKLRKDGLLAILESAFKSSFKGGEVYSRPIGYLIQGKSQDMQLKQKIDEMLLIEGAVRNVAAHQIISVTDEWFREMTGKSAAGIYELMKYLTIRAGIPAKDETWKSYDRMNEILIEMLG